MRGRYSRCWLAHARCRPVACVGAFRGYSAKKKQKKTLQFKRVFTKKISTCRNNKQYPLHLIKGALFHDLFMLRLRVRMRKTHPNALFEAIQRLLSLQTHTPRTQSAVNSTMFIQLHKTPMVCIMTCRNTIKSNIILK